MSGSPGSGGSNPRKFSEKIALHNQKQAEETRAFDQLMTDLTVSRVQFQKIQQLRQTQTRAQYYGGSLPNVNQIGNASADFQGGFPGALDSVRGTRHHGLVERVHRDRNQRINLPHRRPIDKYGRQMESSPYGTVYLSPPPDNNWRREQQPWAEEKRPGFRLISQLNRTNSDSALHTSAMNPQDPFGMNQQMGRGPPQRNASVNEAEVDGSGDVFSFPSLSNEEGLMGVSKPLPKQLWEAKKVQSLSSRPKSCEVPGINIFPSPEQNAGLSNYQGSLNTGGSLPDLSNLHFPSPLPTPLDPDDGHHGGGGYHPNLSGGSSTGNLPAAMMHLGIGNHQGGWTEGGLSSSLSNPSIQNSLQNSQLHSSLSNPSIHSSLRLTSLSNPPQGAMSSSPRRRPAPISPLTLSPGTEQRRGLSKQLSPTMSPSLSPITQGVALDTNSLPMEPPPPYPLYQQLHQQSQHSMGQQQQRQQQRHHHHQQQQQPVSPLQNISLDFNSGSFSRRSYPERLTNYKSISSLSSSPSFTPPYLSPLFSLHLSLFFPQHNNMAAFFNDPFMDPQFSSRQAKALSYQLDQFSMLESAMSQIAGGSCFDPSSPSSSPLYCSQAALMGLGGSHGNLQDQLQQMRPNNNYNCSGGVPNIILTDDSNPSHSKDISSAMSADNMADCFDSEVSFPLEDELRIEPLSLDGLNMLSDPDMVLSDPSVEDSFRSDRL
ncbi:CREB-regulated transcription coactivator 3 isoform X3 [Salvelinus fontinalis]|uniref:CREB-regulated transcription coactivator 3 isoform X3 n=1 Tax=Salvelinus fontinalis TaxID=8038 RepID=UPI0024861091|nr:CREB-regulated transcription coactivator 3 isoform X3 [Salvelinus fontinalis]